MCALTGQRVLPVMGLKKVPHSWSVMRAPKVSAECVSLLHFWVVGAKRAIMCETKWQQTSTCLGQQVVLGFLNIIHLWSVCQ